MTFKQMRILLFFPFPLAKVKTRVIIHKGIMRFKGGKILLDILLYLITKLA